MRLEDLQYKEASKYWCRNGATMRQASGGDDVGPAAFLTLTLDSVDSPPGGL